MWSLAYPTETQFCALSLHSSAFYYTPRKASHGINFREGGQGGKERCANCLLWVALLVLIQLGDDLRFMVIQEGKDVPWTSDLLLDTYGGLVINITTSSVTPKEPKTSSAKAAPCMLLPSSSQKDLWAMAKELIAAHLKPFRFYSVPLPTASRGWLSLVTGKQGVISTKGKPLMTSPHTSGSTEKLPILL